MCVSIPPLIIILSESNYQVKGKLSLNKIREVIVN